MQLLEQWYPEAFSILVGDINSFQEILSRNNFIHPLNLSKFPLFLCTSDFGISLIALFSLIESERLS